MKINIKYSIFDLLFWIAGFSVSLIIFIVMVSESRDIDRYFWAAIASGIFFLISTVMLLHSIKNVQWYTIVDGFITVYCPFGLIKQVRLNQIKKVFQTNVAIYSIKMLAVRRPYIVLCLQKSISKGDIDNAYNRKKKSYVLIPYSVETEILIRTEYKMLCGEELSIK